MGKITINMGKCGTKGAGVRKCIMSAKADPNRVPGLAGET